jgi:phosphate-selective porin OprO and OprP
MSRIRKLFLIGLLLFPAALFAQNQQPPGDEETATDDEPVQKSGERFQLSFKNRPSLRIGEFAQIDFKAKWHFDFRRFSPSAINLPGIVNALPADPDLFYLSKARFGLKGKVTKYFDYEVERDLRADIDETLNEYHPWKDNYVDVNLHRLIHVKIGKFKMPFGLEELGSEDRLDYAIKSRVTDALTPARERGIMLHASRGNRWEYQVGMFRYDGEGSGVHGQPTAGRTFAARVAGQPLRSLKQLPSTIRRIQFGLAGTKGEMFAGQNGVNGQTFSGFTFFDRMFVRGDRKRIGFELAWAEGPASIKGEYMRMSEERRQQGIRGEDLPDKISDGWYVTGGWNLFGKMKSRGGAPENPFWIGRGFGAVELSARLDVLRFYGAKTAAGLPSRSPRAPTILPNSDRTWTFGPTWYLNRFLKIQVNGQREWVTDIDRTAVFGRHSFWSGIVRLQAAM